MFTPFQRMSALQNGAGKLTIGVLGLQGGFSAHMKMIESLGAKALCVRTEEDLKQCNGLIIPGGESTTISLLLTELRSALLTFARNKPLMGTCAGMILMAKENMIAIEIKRNAYGRQAQSFSTSLQVHFPTGTKTCEAIFIRAPKIESLLADDVKVLAYLGDEPVFVQQGTHLALAYHPELTEDTAVHDYFLELVDAEKKQSEN